MDWLSIAAAAICGGLASGLAALLLGRGESSNGVRAGVVMAGLLGGALAHQLLDPEIQIMRMKRELAKQPAMRAIKQYDVGTYETVLAELKDGVRQHKSQAAIIEAAGSKVAQLTLDRLPRASDAAAIAYLQVMVDQMRALDGENCYRFLFPARGSHLEVVRALPEELKRREQVALAEVVRIAHVAPRDVPTVDDVRAPMIKVYEGLSQEFGPRVRLLETGSSAGADRGTVCKLYTSIFDRIVEMPEDQGGPIFRYLVKTMNGQRAKKAY